MGEVPNDSNLDAIGDFLVDHDCVENFHRKQMSDSFDAYKKATTLLGYFSQLRDYTHEYSSLLDKVLSNRKALLCRYKDALTDDYNYIFKQLLMPPTNTEWYQQGIRKYQKVKDYSMYYYRRQLYIALEEDTLNLVSLQKLLHTIVILDKYYDIYDETVNLFMMTCARFEEIMKRHFADYIHL